MSIVTDDTKKYDRSMDPRFATLLGYTPDELDDALRENVEALGAQNGMSVSRRT